MFIDIVEYSLLSQNLGEDRLIEAISGTYQGINEIVAPLGGRIDKSLGDGLLIFFKDSHQALAAGRQIQRETVASGVTQGLVLPLRIGINTAEVLSTNMGDQKRIDVTLMGEGDGATLGIRLQSPSPDGGSWDDREFGGPAVWDAWQGVFDPDQARKRSHHRLAV